jgi:isocitrate/isopropylmalate dehydrogenase
MLSYLGRADAGRRLVAGTVAAIGEGVRTRDLGGTATTNGFADEVCRRL